MKKQYILSFLLVIGIAFNAAAQKTGFVNVQRILSKIPEYQLAQQKLDELAEEYNKELTTQKEIIEKLQQSYQADKILLSKEMREKKEEEINAEKKAYETLKMTRFGKNGDLFKERQKLVKPIQDKVYKAIEEIAEKKNLGMVVDVSSQSGLLYYNEKNDKTEEVLKKLGYL